MSHKNLFQRIQGFLGKKKINFVPKIIPREDHILSRSNISPNALKVLYRLKEMGFASYLVGGGVRDLLLQRKPKDFDIVTDAHPEEVRRIFRNCRLIGRRFRLAHVYFPGEIIEVSTFRANIVEPTLARFPKTLEVTEVAVNKLKRDNTYGTIEEDAWRRDFTVNALYYNIADFKVVDYTDGITDLTNQFIRMIGDPTQRFHEDPVRLLRAIRLAAKLNFNIHPDTQTAVLALKPLLFHVPKARLFDEVLKLFFEGSALLTYQKMLKLGYMALLFPAINIHESEINIPQLIELAMRNSDQRFENNQSLNPGYLFAVLMWPILQEALQKGRVKGLPWFKNFFQSSQETVTLQLKTLMIPRRMLNMIKSIWILQYGLTRRRKNRIFSILHQRYFRAAIDFLDLRAQCGEPLTEMVKWWREFQEADPAQRKIMVDTL